MERVVEERRIDGHRVTIVEDVQDEGVGFLLLVDDVLADDLEPLDSIPSDARIQALLRARESA